MSDIVIKADHLGKRYTIGHQTGRGGGTTFREALIQNTRDLWNKTRDLARGKPIVQGDTQEEVWALKDVSFEIHRGEAVGIIGRNGAGKSTLLKILSRITEPTEGRVTIRGRVASLLEVGTGFHSELTGRENISLNGTILGMTRAEIKLKFDEIVAFAEVEKYLDTPVKRYSSGMYVRLAFAVAAHLEPEILIVDEVLAVGDAEFQKKCLGKMGAISGEGRTVLFVSHNMGAINRLCEKTLWIDKGRVVSSGQTKAVVSRYYSQYITASAEWKRGTERKPGDEFSFQMVSVKNVAGQTTSLFEGSEPVTITISYVITRPLSACQVGVRVYNSEGAVVFSSSDVDPSGHSALPRESGHYVTEFIILGGFLPPGTYSLLVASHMPFRNVYEVIESAVVFEISPTGSLFSLDGRLGVVTPLFPWNTRKEIL